MKNIGYVIKLLRKERGMSQLDLAARLHCTRQSISNYEHNIHRPDYETLCQMADIFRVPVGYFLTQEEMEEELVHARQQAATSLQAQDEVRLVGIYRRLNRKGRDMLLSMADSLAMNPDMLEEKGTSHVG